MSLYKRPGSNHWWCQFRIRGTLHRLSTGELDRAAAEEVEQRLQAEKTLAAPQRRRGVGTLRMLAAADVNRTRAEATADSWIARVETMWVELFFHFEEESDPVDITSEAVFGYVRARKGEKIRNQTIRRELQCLHRALKDAVTRGWLAALPHPWPALKTEPADPKRRGKLHSREAIEKVFALLPEVALDGVSVALATGLRLNELYRVRASWVYAAPAGSTASAVLRMPDGSTKNRKARQLGLSKAAHAIIKRRAHVLGDEIFPRYDYTQAMKRICKRLDLPTLTMRDLRHTFASNALKASGGNLSAVAKAMGHSELEITTLYLHAEEADVLNLASSVITVKRSQSAQRKSPGRLSAEMSEEKMARGRGVEPLTFGFGDRPDRDIAVLSEVSGSENPQPNADECNAIDHSGDHSDPMPEPLSIEEIMSPELSTLLETVREMHPRDDEPAEASFLLVFHDSVS